MRKYTDRKIMVSMIMIVACFSLTGSIFSDAESKEPKLVAIIGEITKISEDYLIVSDRKVTLVDMDDHGIRYTTRILDAEENPMEFSELRVGNWVRVLGADTADGVMCASTIYYLLPHAPGPS